MLDVSVPMMKVCSIAGLLGRRERDASVTTVVRCGGRPDWAKKLNKKIRKNSTLAPDSEYSTLYPIRL